VREGAADVIRILATLSVAAVVFSQGLGISPRLVRGYFRERPWMIVRSLLAALVVVPAISLALILVLEPAPGLAIGLAILVACPPAPLMIATAPRKGGASAAFIASLHLSLAGLAFVTVPVVLYLLSLGLGFSADVHLGAMTWILARTILLPLGFGLVCRALLPGFADRAGSVLAVVGNIGVLIVLAIVLMAFFRTLLDVDARSYMVIVAVGVAALATGHLLGPCDPRERTALAVECGARHPALALSIASANFGPERAISVLVPCILTFAVIAIAYMTFRSRSVAAAP